MRWEIVLIPLAQVQGKQHDWWIRYFRWGTTEQLKHGTLLAGWNLSQHFSIHGILLRQCVEIYLVYLIQETCKVLNFCLQTHTVSVCVHVYIFMCVYTYVIGMLLWLAAPQIQDTKIQQFHNSLPTFTDFFSLLNHNHSLHCVRSDDKDHWLIMVPRNSEYWSWTSY